MANQSLERRKLVPPNKERFYYFIEESAPVSQKAWKYILAQVRRMGKNPPLSRSTQSLGTTKKGN